MNSWKILSLWAPVGAFMGLLFLLSAQEAFPVSIRGWDKLMHAGAYGVLGVLALRACHGGIRRLAVGPTLLALLLTLAYAALDELHQSRVPGRVASIADWVADATGACLAVPFVALLVALRSALFGSASLGPDS